MSVLYADQVFAPLDSDLHMERIAGGNETEVYCTDDRRYVVKLKHELGGSATTARALAHQMRVGADEYAACLGPEHSITSHYVVSRGADGRVQVLVIQPFLVEARPLSTVDYAALPEQTRAEVASQLRAIIRRALTFYRRTGSMPDLYGRTSASSDERARLKKPWMLPARLWSFLVARNLLRSHNLMLTNTTPARVVLVDYDLVRRSPLYRRVYYTVRWLLFLRDQVLIVLLNR